LAKICALISWIQLLLSRADISRTESPKDFCLTPWGAGEDKGIAGIELTVGGIIGVLQSV